MKKLDRQKTTATVGWVACVLMAISLALTGCQTTPDRIMFSPDPVDGTTGTPIYSEAARLAVGDYVKVTLSGIQEPPPPHEEQIKEDGTITLPNLDPVKAEGKTLGELQKEIYTKYVPLIYKRLTVTVSSEKRVYYVQGQVRNPGRQEYLGQTTVLKAIASAQDFTDFADRRKVFLTRADGTRVTVDCVKAAKDSTYDLPVFPGDKIEVIMRGPTSIFGL